MSDETEWPREMFFHAKRDPLICPGMDDHEFTGWREIRNDAGQVCGGETVCKHCGIGAMEHTLALDF